MKKRILCIILTLVMLMGLLPAGVSAATPEKAAGGVSIDFTNPADAGKFTVDNQTDSEIKEGEGFYMISTNESFEDCKGQLSGDAATTPRDAVQVPVSGDWTATLYLKVDTSGSNGQYEFICLYGMADYDNGCGIRAGNGSTVNYKEVGGVNESSIDGMKVQTGLTSGTDHWYRLEKVGTSYTGYLSEDGEEYQKVFTYEDTGIEAKMIVIDAYSGRSVGYQYWLQSLEIEGGEPAQKPYTLTDSIEIGKTYVIVADGQYALTNRQEGPALRTYAGSATTTLASKPVTVADGAITSDITEDMLWTVEASTASAAYDGLEQYFLKDASGNYLRRGSGSSGQGAQLLAEPNLYSTIRYNAWSFYPYEGENAFAMYANSERSYGTDYPFYVYGNETSFDSPGRAQREEADPFAFTRNDDCSHIQLFEVDGEVAPPCEHEYTAVVTEPTCTAKGYTTYTCTKCGDSYVGDEVAALGHDYVDGVCTRCGKKDPNKPVLVYTAADSVEAGKTYVIVADGKYALNNVSVDLGSYSSSTTNSLGATEVSIEGGMIVSDVPDSILWTFQEPGDIQPATDGQPMFFITDAEGRYLRRRSGSTATAPLEVGEELASSIQYNTWSVWPYDDGTFAIYCNSYRGERSSDTTQYQDYPFHLYGRAEGFDAPGEARYFENPFDFVNASNCSHLQLFELTESSATEIIHFADPADNDKYEIVGPTAYEQTADGLIIKATRNAIEDCKGQNSGDQATTPEDLIEVPVSGNWTATLQFGFDTGDAANGYYQFFGFFASEGDDYQNMVGIRGGDKALQDFIRKEGTVTADTDELVSAPGLAEITDYWMQIVKDGDTYTCYRSDDGGETFSEMFSYEGSGIDATKLVIDAYTGRTEGYTFTLKTLEIVTEGSTCAHVYVDVVVPPTCYERGYTEHTCTKCGRVYRSDFVDKLEHVWDESKTVIIPPTCTEKGYTDRTCSLCGDTFEFDYVDELLHDWPKEGVVTKEATETERGELTFTCTRCGATKTRPIAAGTEKAHKNEILFISDVHSAKRAENGFHNLRAMFRLLKENDDFVPEVVSGGGDYIESSTNDDADWPHCYEVLHDIMYNTSPDTYQTLGSGNHEWEWSRQSEEMIEKLLGEPRVGVGYETDDFAIFHIGAYMNGTNQEHYKDEDLAALKAFLDQQVASGEKKVIFIQTHFPLHYAYNWAWRTTRNAGAMIDMLNEYSQYLDICFVWGHNHHQDAMRHQFKGRGDVLQISETESKQILFNYFNAGCLNENAAEQDAGPSGSDYGPGYCLEVKLEGDKLILDYGHITGAYPDPDQAKFDHNADLLYVEEIQEARESHCEVQLLRHGECEHDYVAYETA
ncbi:MAG: metallophosphoesterase, partial [Oscillospiraceae bacterium]|nr:metallophosphoesterase [Oscillospiraceae bacterium]